jgi:hypothetical protein
MTCRDFRYYYTDALFKGEANNPLGIIPLKNLYAVVPLDVNEQGIY